MGISGLETFVEGAAKRKGGTPLGRRVNLAHVARKRGGMELLIDTGGFHHWMFTELRLPWVYGGEYHEYRKGLQTFVTSLRGHGITPVFFLDGVREAKKRTTHLSRARQNRKRAMRGVEMVERKARIPHALHSFPVGLSDVLYRTVVDMGVEVYISPTEADYLIATEFVRRGAYGVLAKDSDFLVYPVRYLPLPTFSLTARAAHATVFEHGAVARGVGLQPEHMYVLAALLGNDYHAGYRDMLTRKLFPERVAAAKEKEEKQEKKEKKGSAEEVGDDDVVDADDDGDGDGDGDGNGDGGGGAGRVSKTKKKKVRVVVRAGEMLARLLPFVGEHFASDHAQFVRAHFPHNKTLEGNLERCRVLYQLQDEAQQQSHTGMLDCNGDPIDMRIVLASLQGRLGSTMLTMMHIGEYWGVSSLLLQAGRATPFECTLGLRQRIYGLLLPCMQRPRARMTEAGRHADGFDVQDVERAHATPFVRKAGHGAAAMETFLTLEHASVARRRLVYLGMVHGLTSDALLVKFGSFLHALFANVPSKHMVLVCALRSMLATVPDVRLFEIEALLVHVVSMGEQGPPHLPFFVKPIAGACHIGAHFCMAVSHARQLHQLCHLPFAARGVGDLYAGRLFHLTYGTLERLGEPLLRLTDATRGVLRHSRRVLEEYLTLRAMVLWGSVHDPSGGTKRFVPARK